MNPEYPKKKYLIIDLNALPVGELMSIEREAHNHSNK